MSRRRAGQTLKPREQKFVEEFLVDLNARDAAIRAGYPARSARTYGPRVLARDCVAAALKLAMAARAARTQVTQDKTLLELARIGFSDVGDMFDADGKFKKFIDMTEGARRAIASVEVDEIFDRDSDNQKIQVGITRKIKLWDKNSALTNIARHLGMFAKDNEQVATSLAEIVLASQRIREEKK